MSNNLDHIIKKVLLEYRDPNNTYDPSGGLGAARMASGLPATGSAKFDNQVLNKSIENAMSVKSSTCVPGQYVSSIRKLKDSGASTLLLKAVLGIIGRESDFGGGDFSIMSKKWWSYNVKNSVKKVKSVFDNNPTLYNITFGYIGDQTSLGPGQITKATADQYKITGDLNVISTAVNGIYKILLSNYNLAIKNGYSTNKPSSNFTRGTGNAALDLAIAGHNLGEGKITKYCETSNPKVKNLCSLAGKVVNGFKVYNKPVANYLPNYGTKLTTHNYVAEVANRIKGFSCVDNYWGGPISGVFNNSLKAIPTGTKSAWDGNTPGDLRYWRVLYSRILKSGLGVKLDPQSGGKIEKANYLYYGPWIIWKDTNKNGGYPISSGNGTINKTSVVGKITTYGGKYAGEDISKTIVQLKGGNTKKYYLTAFLKSTAQGLVSQNTK